jgi:hypothetical protein
VGGAGATGREARKRTEKLEAVLACAERLYALLSEVGSFWLSAETVPEISMCLLCICGVIFGSSICVSGPLKTKNEAAWYLIRLEVPL